MSTTIYVQDRVKYSPSDDIYNKIETVYNSVGLSKRNAFDDIILIDAKNILKKGNTLRGLSAAARPHSMADIFDKKGERYQVKKYVGYIYDKENDIEIEIGSKFDNSGENHFVHYMLSNILNIDRWLVTEMYGKEQTSMSSVSGMLNNIVILNFLDTFNEAIRKGSFRKYKNVAYNDSKMRGSLDVSRHIRLNIPENGKIAYNTREYRSDNEYNVLFLKALMIAEKFAPGIVKGKMSENREFKKNIDAMKNSIFGWKDAKVNALLRATEKKIVNSHLKIYEELRVLARYIIRQYGLSKGDGAEYRNTGILVNVDDLWECFVDKMIFQKSYLAEYSTDYVQQEFSILQTGAGDNDAIGNGRKMRPDFIWKDLRLVIDAKNKTHWSQALGGDWSFHRSGNVDADEDNDFMREDIYQVLGYMLTFECETGGFIFPVSYEHNLAAAEPYLVREIREGSGKYLKLYPFKVPEGSNGYTDFVKEVRGSEDYLIQLVNRNRQK